MAHDESRPQGNENSTTTERNREAVAPLTVDTADPVIESAVEHRSGRNDGPPRQERPSMIKHLLITASVALICGVSGAMGYGYFFGPKEKAASTDHSQAKGDPGSKKKSESTANRGASDNKQSGDDSSVQASTANSTSAVPSAQDAAMVKRQLKDLSQRVDDLLERVEGVTRPVDQTPPLLRMMQIKMTKLAHEIADLAALPGAYREYDNRLETFKDELSALRTRIETAQADPTTGRIAGVADRAAPALSSGGSDRSNPPAVLLVTPTPNNAPSGGP
jgi:hypothetical protein